MARPRDDWTSELPRGDWVPPAWNEPSHQIEVDPEPPARIPSRPRQTNRPAATPRTAPDVTSRRVLAIAVPQVITGVVAFLASALGFFSDEAGTVPTGFFLLLVVQLVGFAVTHREEPAVLRRSWVVGLVVTLVALPVAAIHVALARQPYTGTDAATALPLVSATVAMALLLVMTAIALAFSSHDVPEEAGLAFMPMALVIPAVIGIRSDVTEADALRALGESALVAAAATALAWSLPRQSRLLVPPIALAVQIVLLWMMGQGPSFPSNRGGVVPLTQGSLLALVVILVVGTPIVAMWARGVTAAADERSRERGLPELDSLR